MQRRMVKGLITAVLVLWTGLALAGWPLPGGALGSTGGSGFFSAGHWVSSPIGSLTPIFPLADSVTGATARVHQAYWDGTNDVEYDVAMGDEFGAYPYVCTLVQGPPGMVVAQSIYTTFQNANYCRVTWHPQGNISSAWNGEVEIAVTDQTHTTIDMSWALWTVGQYTTSSFSAAYSVSGSTLTITGTCTGSLTPGEVVSDGVNFPAGTYVAFDLTGTGCDGTYALSTAPGGTPSGTITGAYAGGSVFVSTTGSGSTCTYSAPCTFATAFGSTYSATSFPGAVAYAFGGSYSGTPGGSNTNLPYYTDTDTGTNGFEANSSRKPNALIGIPGATVTLDATAANTAGYPRLIQLGSHTPDWYMENITANGYNTAAVDQLIEMGHSGRLTFDQVNWTNSGYGTGTSGNMSMFVSTGVQNPTSYLFITDSSESNRESGSVGNNFGFIDLYSYSYALLQRNVENSPSANLDDTFYYKSDVTNSSLRENYADVSGSAQGAFDYLQSQYSGNGNDETCYNLGINIPYIAVGNQNFTWQPVAVYRNTLLSGSGLGIKTVDTTFNLEGPGNGATSGPVSAVSSTTSGSLVASTQYTWGITSVGVTGESSPTIGSNGNASSGKVAGSSNEVSITIATGDSAAQLSWLSEPGAVSYNAYRELTSCGGGAGCWTEYTNVTSPWTDTGAAGTSANPPSTSTAISTARFTYLANAISTTNATPPPPTGSTIVTTSTGITNNLTDSATPCTSPATTCIIQSNGQLNPSNATGAADAGLIGYQIQ